MNPLLLHVLHQTAFGAVAAAGFGVLFNVRFRVLPVCALSGALALFIRTSATDGIGFSLVGASFAAALAVGMAAQLTRERAEISQEVIGVVGCIPMVPGAIAAKAILGLFTFTRGDIASDSRFLVSGMQYSLVVVFTIGAIGTGLAIPTLLARVRVPRLT